MVSQLFLDVAARFQGAAERNGLVEADFGNFNFWAQGTLISRLGPTPLRIYEMPICVMLLASPLNLV